MMGLFQKPSKMALTSLIATVFIFILLMLVLDLSDVDSNFVHMFGKVTIAVSLPLLIISPLVGVIYSFFMKGKRKILYVLVHLACICTVSVFAFIAIMFRYFVPFAP